MQEVRFTKAAPWCCPSYKGYYIQERAVGKGVYGHEAYEYALFRRQLFRVIRRFRTRKRAYEYVSRLTGLTRWDVKMGSHNIVVNDRDYLGVIYEGTMYRISKRSKEVATRPLEDERLTGWHDRYIDCLSEAKEIVKNIEVIT